MFNENLQYSGVIQKVQSENNVVLRIKEIEGQVVLGFGYGKRRENIMEMKYRIDQV